MYHMNESSLRSDLVAAQVAAPKANRKSKLFSTVLPPSIKYFIEREADRNQSSFATVLRQLIAKGIEDALQNNPPPWWEEFKESVNPPPKYERLSLPAKSKEAKS